MASSNQPDYTKIKMVLTDIDGVWTDAGMYYTENGDEIKKFTTTDSAGVVFLRLLEIPMAIVTGERTKMVADRAQKLKLKYVFQGVKNKVAVAKELGEELGVKLDEMAYVGDDINDILLLREVGLSAAPANAAEYVKSEVHVNLKKSGGEGAFREFVELILQKQGRFKEALEKYFEFQQSFNQ